mmetsp:Transcript_25467/g.37560  ORF Transcript_25467/g.37560 Transcript_25467/m.37560 type:complete len:1258 (-) Transcript_25467:112-3885(-)
MHLLSLNLQKSSAIVTAIYGNFSAPKNQEIVIARGSTLELLRPDDTGKLISICETPLFAVIRSLLPFRLAGANKDYVVVGSDSGKITILEFNADANDWKSVHCEVFGKTGCRRIVPGQYVAADPKGRALMIGSIEKQKFVYIMNRDSANRLTISSPLEAHKTETVIFSICGVDVGFDNPVFAMIELEYKDADEDPTGEAAMEAEKRLTYYELDLGLNHVVRKWSEPISRTANMLLTVPGGDDGPSGVLICGENWVGYKNQGHPEVRTALPRRRDMPIQRGLLITSAAVHKQRGLFFFMLQSELGDLYKVSLTLSPTDKKVVTDVVVTVFDTLPPAVSFCITKTGLMFSASEFGNHMLLQFQNLGDDENAVVAHCVGEEINEELGDDSVSACRVALSFTPSPVLKNLAVTDEIESMAPVTDMIIDDIGGEGTPQIYSLCGRGNRSTMRVLRHGVSVTEMAVSELPGRPNAVWTVRDHQESENDKYIIVSFSNATLVLSIGDDVEEVTDSGFLASVPTLDVALMADNALLQVHPTGIRHIRRDPHSGNEKRISEWKTPGKRQIERASANSRQVAISLAGGEITYFEIDQAGQLVEMKTHDFGHQVACLDVGEVPAGRSRSSFLAVGGYDNTVQILSLEPNDLLVMRSTMMLPKRPESVCLVHMDSEASAAAPEAGSSSAGQKKGYTSAMYLNIGLVNGVLHRVAVDSTAGTMSDSRCRLLGIKPVKLFRVMVRGRRGVLALSTRTWLLYNYQGRYFQAPISYETLEFASNFASEVCPEGIVAIASNTLRIITVDNLGAMFNQTVHPLRYTPRKMLRLPGTSHVAVIETDHNEYGEAEKEKLAAAMAAESSSSENKEQNGDDDMEIDSESTTNGQAVENTVNGTDDDAEGDEEVRLPVRGPLPPTEGHWASCIRIMDPVSGNALELLELTDNEAAFSICTCVFSHISEEMFIVVGTAKDMTLHPRKVTCGYINVYRLLGDRLQLLHKTPLEDVPLALCEFHGKLLVGVGRSIRMFELGKKKLLRKCENKGFPSGIMKLHVNGDRIYASDMSESVHFVKYRRQDNSLVIFADEYSPRYMTTSCILDYDTVAGADKFGNVWVLQLPFKANDDIDNPTGSRLLWDQGLLNGAPTKAQLLTHFHLGEAVTSMVKCSFVPGGEEAIIVATVMGGIYAFLPFRRKDDVEFFQHLEMYMRQEWPSLVQRDHLSYRSYFQPVKDTVDGDLCEQYGRMPPSKQKEIADDLNRTPPEMMKKLEETRNSLL